MPATHFFVYFSHENYGNQGTFPHLLEQMTLRESFESGSAFKVNLANFIIRNSAKINDAAAVVRESLNLTALEKEFSKGSYFPLKISLVYPDELHSTYLIAPKDEVLTQFDSGVSHNQIMKCLENVQKNLSRTIEVKVTSIKQDKIDQNIKTAIEKSFSDKLSSISAKRISIKDIAPSEDDASIAVQSPNAASDQKNSLRPLPKTKGQCCAIA